MTDLEVSKGEKSNEITLSCSTEYKEYVFNEKHDIWTLVSLKAPSQEDDEDEEKRAPIDVVAVIDKSGSMAGAKLKLVKKTLEFVLTQLNENDCLSVVTYDTNVYVDFALIKMNKENKHMALSKISSICDGSCTNLCGGLMKGLCQIIDRQEKNEVASVLLFTDGLANQGIRSASGIVKAMKDPKKFDGPSSSTPPTQQQQQQQQQPHQSWLKNMFGGTKNEPKQEKVASIGEDENKAANASVYTFGFGTDHNPEMLKEISDAGNGMYYYIENEDKIAESFGHCLGGLLSTVAQGIQLQVTLGDGVLIKEVHSGRSFEQSSDNKSVKVNMGDLQSEENRDIVLELTIEAVNAPYETTPQPLYNVSVDYFSVMTDNLENIHEKLTVLRTEKNVVHDASNSDVRLNKERARVKMTKAMRNANVVADSGDLIGARKMMQEEIKAIRLTSDGAGAASAVEHDELEQLRGGYDDMIQDLERVSENLSDMGQWRSKGKKMQMNMMQQHDVQRSSNLTSRAYQTKGKMKRRSEAKRYVKGEEEDE